MSNQTDDFLRAREWAERAGRLEAERDALLAEVTEWRKLRDPANLHVNLLRGLPAQLTREQAMHLCADDLQRIAELEAVARHEADCAEAFKAEAESLRKDAERYRHLRRPDVDIEGCALIYCTESLDEMVDASIEASDNIVSAIFRDDLEPAPAGKGNT